jgi:CBS domain-containing protein
MEEKTAQDIMTKDVITISKDATLADLSKLLLKNKISGLPVIDEEGRLVGMATDADIIREDMEPIFPFYFDPLVINYGYIENIEKYQKDMKEHFETRIEEVMERRVKTVQKDTPISDVARIIIRNKINRVPVVDENNKLLGIIARSDIIESMVDEADRKE